MPDRKGSSFRSGVALGLGAPAVSGWFDEDAGQAGLAVGRAERDAACLDFLTECLGWGTLTLNQVREAIGSTGRTVPSRTALEAELELRKDTP